MKPNFTLFLSADGLRLLHRSGSGWQLVGTANVSSPTLAGDLDVLRKTAAGLEPQGLRCRLILPNDQIRYLSINANGLDTGDCRAAVMKALDGVTPYRLEDLVIDFTLDRTQCHMAAVARETLEEAEQFALAHGFTPVCFAALPHDPIFAWEPSFGVTQHAKEASLEVDLVDPPYVEASTNRIEQTETPVSEAPVATPAEPLFRTRRAAAPASRAGQKRPEFSPRADAQTEDYAVAGFAAPQKPFAPRRRPEPAV
jgi:hypothetical protein